MNDVIPPDPIENDAGSEGELDQTLKDAESDIVKRAAESSPSALSQELQSSWAEARKLIQQFAPVPWFMRRISSFVFAAQGSQSKKIPLGYLTGLHKLLFSAAADPVAGSGEKMTDPAKALAAVSNDAFAALAVVHGVCRKFAKRKMEQLWKPIVEDALLRCQIGFWLGEVAGKFGAGKGILSGFAGRCGLAILLATGTEQQAADTLHALSSGEEIDKVCLRVYGCDPLQVSAMTLLAAGCGRDAAFGTLLFGRKHLKVEEEQPEELQWYASFTLCEEIRMGRGRGVPASVWGILEIPLVEQERILKDSKMLARRGADWQWLL